MNGEHSELVVGYKGRYVACRMSVGLRISPDIRITTTGSSHVLIPDHICTPLMYQSGPLCLSFLFRLVRVILIYLLYEGQGQKADIGLA